jgi:hypothetical protein
MYAWAATPEFEVDNELQVNARKWAEEFIKFAADKYEVELDFSLDSIKYLDDIADDLHQTNVNEKPAEELIVPVTRALGSYIAEVYRIFNGGKWGWLVREDGTFPAVQTTNGASFLPIAKAFDRIETGAEPDIWEYYLLLNKQ